jgi:hypothetical protein
MKPASTSRKNKNGKGVQDDLLRLAGTLRDLPDDLAMNHDFYLYGTPKQQPRRGRWLARGQAARTPTATQVEEFNRKMDKLAAELNDLPADLAQNLDHYVHGHPKR